MARVKSSSARKHREVKKAAKGFKAARRKRVKSAKEALLHSGQYAFIGRKLKRRDLRRLWITRINAAVRPHGLNYSGFINKLNEKKVTLNRKMLSEIALNDPGTFEEIVKEVK